MTNIFTRFLFPARFVLCLLFIQLFISTDAFSQGKFLDGYIISPSGDTLKGLIQYEEWDANPYHINFTNPEGIVQKIFSSEVKGFFILKTNEIYKSHRIGMLNIDLRESYNVAPSLQAKDSSDYFLKEITFGLHASLLEYKNTDGVPHYFLKKQSKLTELFNYPFYRIVDNKKYLILYDQYKNQLPLLLSDSQSFDIKIPSYDRKNLKTYIEKYNESFGVIKYKKEADEQSDFNVDLNFSAGVEGWNEPGMNLKYKPSYGIGIRFNLSRNFHNRYIKLNYQIIPSVQIAQVYTNYAEEKIDFKAFEAGIGSYFGSGKIKPFAGIDCSFPTPNWRTAILAPHFGIGFLRQFNLEVSHLIDLYSVVSKNPFFNKPRVSISYYLNLNKLFTRK